MLRLFSLHSLSMVSRLAALCGVAIGMGSIQARSAEAGTGWKSLFDGKNFSGWHTHGSRTPVKWRIENGAISWTEKAGDLATDEQFGNFEFEFEWKISPGGNSGVIFHVDPVSTDRRGAARSGVEYQILDDAGHKDGQNPKTSAGSLYGLYARSVAAAKPVGEWNQGRILVQGGRVEYWLNGQKVVSAEIGSDDWKARVAGSKFSKWPEYAAFARGYIVLQDHNNPVWFRNLRIRALP